MSKNKILELDNNIVIPDGNFADKINQSKIENREDLKKTISNPEFGKMAKPMGKILPTPFDRPIKGSRMIVICGSQVPIYEKKVAQNPDYWKDEQIGFVYIISDEDYAILQRKRYEHMQMQTVDEFNEEETIKSLGLVVNQGIQVV